MRLPTRRFVILFLMALLIATTGSATSVKQMNLEELSEHAEMIFRGKVVSVTDGKVAVGGGELATVTYRILVEDEIRGAFPVQKGVKYYDLTMVGKSRAGQASGSSSRVFSITGLPRVQVGRTYLFMTTPRSSIGLSTTVGLGQGIFLITRIGKDELAANELNNKGLYYKMSAARGRVSSQAAAPAGSGPIPYAELKQQIRSIIGQ
jgi:hypothetical protein